MVYTTAKKLLKSLRLRIESWSIIISKVEKVLVLLIPICFSMLWQTCGAYSCIVVHAYLYIMLIILISFTINGIIIRNCPFRLSVLMNFAEYWSWYFKSSNNVICQFNGPCLGLKNDVNFETLSSHIYMTK